MRKLIIPLVVLSLWLAACVDRAGAAPIVSTFQDGLVNKLEDDDLEILVNSGKTILDPGTGTAAGADNSIDVGDYLVGVLRFTAIYAPPNTKIADYTTQTISGLFVAEVATRDDGSPGFADFTFAPAGADAWTDIGMPVTPESDSSFIVLYDDLDNVDFATGDDNSNGTNADDMFAQVDGTLLWEFGFTGDVDEGWTSFGVPSTVDPTFTGALGTFNAGLGVTHTYPGGSTVIFNESVGSSALFDPSGDGNDLIQVRVEGDISGADESGNGSGDFGNFEVVSDTDVFFQPTLVPEPSSIMLITIGSLALSGFAVGRRRKRLMKKVDVNV